MAASDSFIERLTRHLAPHLAEQGWTSKWRTFYVLLLVGESTAGIAQVTGWKESTIETYLRTPWCPFGMHGRRSVREDALTVFMNRIEDLEATLEHAQDQFTQVTAELERLRRGTQLEREREIDVPLDQSWLAVLAA